MNTIELAKIYQTNLDKQVVAAAATGWMEANAGQVIYTGGNEIKIPKLALDGLGDYDRSGGFTNGAVDFSYQTMTMTQDRGRSFSLDAMDVNETNFAATAGSILGEFQRTKVVPEVDAYRLSYLASTAITEDKATFSYTPAAATILGKLKSDIAAIKDVAGEVELVIMISQPALAVLEQADQITRFLNVGEMNVGGEVRTGIKMLDGNYIVGVSSARMKSAYTFLDGKTVGQEAGGFAPAVGAKSANWIIVPRTAPIAVSKTDAIRIFDPMNNQAANAWKVDYRKYHEVFLPENQVETLRVNFVEAE